MDFPQQGDYIDIHNHDSKPGEGVFILDNLMAHEGLLPVNRSGVVYSMGIHPWFLNETNHDQLIGFVRQNASSKLIAAIGEAGFDKLRGPSMDLQHRTFSEQAVLSEEIGKPMVIHCVKAWDELMAAHRKIRPKLPWLIHGFRGKKELAIQLIAKNMYISFWFDFIIRPEASVLVRSLPVDRIFLETDGSGADIKEIYHKVADDLGISIEKLKEIIYSNFIEFLPPNPPRGA
jgi:TatD DNase family protein